jgi:hypothetical protein
MLIDAVGKLLGGGLARAARDYINIIGGFVGQGMLFCAALQWCVLRTHLQRFYIALQSAKITNRSSTAPLQIL